MRITLEQSGGFAGLTLRRTLDTTTLAPDEAAVVEALLAQADLFGLPEAAPAQRRGFDMQRYRLTAEDGERSRTLHLHDGSVPDAVRPLLAFLGRLRPDAR